jgi:hypothetical protein
MCYTNVDYFLKAYEDCKPNPWLANRKHNPHKMDNGRLYQNINPKKWLFFLPMETNEEWLHERISHFFEFQ